MEEKKKLRAAIYIRVSTSEVSSKGVSTIAQKRDIENFIKLHSGEYEKIKKEYIYIDNGFSGASEDRPGLNNLMEDAKNNKFDIVLVWKIDRFFRKTLFLLEYIEKLTDLNVSFKSVTQNFNTVGPYGKMLLGVFGIIAEMERDLIRERTMMGRKMKAEKGYYVGGGTISYGYERIDEGIGKKIKIVEEEAIVIKRIFDLFVNEKKSINEIAKLLTAEKILTKHNKRNFNDKEKKKEMKIGAWYPTTVSQLLKNEMYIGKYYYGTKEYIFDKENNKRKVINVPRDKWNNFDCPIILNDIILFEKAQVLIEKNKLTKNNKTSHYFAGLIRCKQCGKSYFGYKGSKGTINYRCGGTKKDKMIGRELCKNSGVSEKILLENIWNRLDKIFRNPEEVLEAYYKMEFEESSKINLLKKERKNIDLLIEKEESKMLKMQDDFYSVSGVIKKSLEKNIGISEDKINILYERIDEVIKRINDFENVKKNKKDLIKLMKVYNNIYLKLTEKDKLEIIKELVERIDINNKNINIIFKFSIKNNKKGGGGEKNKELECITGKEKTKKLYGVMGNTETVQ